MWTLMNWNKAMMLATTSFTPRRNPNLSPVTVAGTNPSDVRQTEIKPLLQLRGNFRPPVGSPVEVDDHGRINTPLQSSACG